MANGTQEQLSKARSLASKNAKERNAALKALESANRKLKSAGGKARNFLSPAVAGAKDAIGKLPAVGVVMAFRPIGKEVAKRVGLEGVTEEIVGDAAGVLVGYILCMLAGKRKMAQNIVSFGVMIGAWETVEPYVTDFMDETIASVMGVFSGTSARGIDGADYGPAAEHVLNEMAGGADVASLAAML